MMKLIVGLGNPGSKHRNDRHNVGHWAIDYLSNLKPKISNLKLVKTSVFMNESGKEIKQLTINHKLLTRDLLIVHDDLDLGIGKWKLQFGRSSAGHKGVQSIIDELGTVKFWRLRIGIGKPPPGVEGDWFVLEEPTVEEKKLINKAIEESVPYVLEWTHAL
jgi:PTH1 family peptidyl-tRNA hydrolase